MPGAVTGGLERLDHRRASRCERAVADGVSQAAGGAAVRADVCGQHGTRDEATLVLQRMRLVDAAPLAVVAAQRTRLLWPTDAASPLPRLLLLLLLLLLTKRNINALSSSFLGPQSK